MSNFNSYIIPLGNVGFATDLPKQTRDLTHFEILENAIFEVSGYLRKVGGNTRLNSSAISGNPSIMGFFDFWRSGGAATFTQKGVIVTSDGKVYKEDADGVWDDITGAASITPNSIPVFCQARDLLLIFTSANDTPLKWNQSGNVASLGGSPPAGRGAVFHANRVWVWGANANPSRITYSSSTDAEDYTGADTGSIDIDPEDGDRIVGAVSYKKKLVIFKGPNKGSIHVIEGTAPTGADAFSRTLLVRGIALQTHNSIVPVLDDIWFASDRGIHSLAATEQYGDFHGAFLTRFLQSFWRENVSRTRLEHWWGCNYADKGCALWVYTATGSSVNNRTLGISYSRLEEDGLKPFIWTRGGACCGIRINGGVREVVFGGVANGFMTREDMDDRSLNNSTAYSLRVKTPRLLFAEVEGGMPYAVGNIEDFALRSVSVGDWNVNVTLTRDNIASETYRFNQGADITTTAGFILGTSILGIDTLGGGATEGGPQIAYASADPDATSIGGHARTIQVEITQGGLNEDAHLIEAVAFWTPAAYSTATNIEANT